MRDRGATERRLPFVTLVAVVVWGGDPADTRVIFDANLPQREYQIHFQSLSAAFFFTSIFFPSSSSSLLIPSH